MESNGGGADQTRSQDLRMRLVHSAQQLATSRRLLRLVDSCGSLQRFSLILNITGLIQNKVFISKSIQKKLGLVPLMLIYLRYDSY